MNSTRARTPFAALLFTAGLGLSCWAVACGSTSAPSAAPPAPSAAVVPAPPPADPSACAPRDPQPSAPAAPVAVATRTSDDSREALSRAQLRIKRLVLARSVQGREPQVPLQQVAAGNEPLYAFVEVENLSAHDGAIVITFEKAGTRTGNIELRVPASHDRWRTWGYSRGVREPGSWAVVVRSAGGRELARTAFEAT